MVLTRGEIVDCHIKIKMIKNNNYKSHSFIMYMCENIKVGYIKCPQVFEKGLKRSEVLQNIILNLLFMLWRNFVYK